MSRSLSKSCKELKGYPKPASGRFLILSSSLWPSISGLMGDRSVIDVRHLSPSQQRLGILLAWGKAQVTYLLTQTTWRDMGSNTLTAVASTILRMHSIYRRSQ